MYGHTAEGVFDTPVAIAGIAGDRTSSALL
jgi:hypothetical protein